MNEILFQHSCQKHFSNLKRDFKKLFRGSIFRLYSDVLLVNLKKVFSTNPRVLKTKIHQLPLLFSDYRPPAFECETTYNIAEAHFVSFSMPGFAVHVPSC